MDRIKVLIADDVRGLRDLLKMHLRQYNCEVCKDVDDGRKVIDAIRQSEPDIVFLDIDMPGMNGLDVLKEIKKNDIHNKVWIVSGEDGKDKKELAARYGAKGFISKPFTIEQIGNVVSEYGKLNSKEVREAGERKKRDRKLKDSKEITVFIADDEDLMQQLLENVLLKCQCTVEAKAFSGNDVISRFESGIVPDITFLDIEMPDGDGLEVLKYIKDNKVKTFSVMVSAHGTFENVKNAMDSGADGFIVKPYSEKKVVEMIKKYRKNN